jgi:hypothetical protein
VDFLRVTTRGVVLHQGNHNGQPEFDQLAWWPKVNDRTRPRLVRFQPDGE